MHEIIGTARRVTMPAARATLAPALEPETGKRAHVKAWRRELAGWLRDNGIGATGAPWDAAVAGERDLTVLRVAAADAGTLARHWSGTVMPAALAAGDTTDYGQVVCAARRERVRGFPCHP